jgi:predicted hotdog family 3-hydroxylacyl-ACP dehydratase
MSTIATYAGRPVVDLLPHRGPAVVINAIVSLSETGATCDATLVASVGPRIEAWFTIEHMAQTVGIWAGARGLARGRNPSPGYLVGTRRLDCHDVVLAGGDRLRIVATLVTETDAGLAVFDCAVVRLSDERLEPVAEASIIVMSPAAAAESTRPEPTGSDLSSQQQGCADGG